MHLSSNSYSLQWDDMHNFNSILANNGLDHVCLVNKNVKSMSYNWIIDATLIHRNKTIKDQIVTSNDQFYVLIEAF